MLVHPPSSTPLPNQKAQSAVLRQLTQPLNIRLTVGNQILLRMMLCALSFTVGIGYSDRQVQPEPRVVSAIALPQKLIAQLPRSPAPAPIIPTIRIKAVGDMVLGTNFPSNRLHPQPTALLSAIAPLLQDADLVFGNFESTLTNTNASSKDTSRPNVFAFRTPPDYNELLRNAGFDVLSIANNHALDFGLKGFSDTANAIEQAGMQAVGRKGKIVYTTTDLATIAWIGFGYGRNLDIIQALGSAKSLVKVAQENADVVVVSVHAGAEGTGAMRTRNKTEYFFGENRGNLVEFSHTLIDAGADLILGHGPHVPRALELHQGKLIAYSLGNFVGYRTLSTQAQLGYSLVLEVELDEQGDFVQGKIHPVRLSSSGIPAPSAKGETIDLMRRLTQSDFPQTPLKIDADGMIVPQP